MDRFNVAYSMNEWFNVPKNMDEWDGIAYNNGGKVFVGDSKFEL